MKLAVALALTLGACSVPSVDYSGKQCPCPSGYACNAATQTCTRGEAGSDAAASDADHGDSASDSASATSCLVGLDTPFTRLTYSTSDFTDFGTAWMTDGGTWQQQGGELQQTSTSAQLAVAYYQISPVVGTTNMRLVTSMRATSSGNGDAIELTARVNAADTHMYHCNWEPADGAFIIMRTDSVTLGATLNQVTIDLAAIAGYQETEPVTMEFQVNGSLFSCCLHNIPGATVQGSDTTYQTGDVGVKTYEMAGAFHDFALYMQ